MAVTAKILTSAGRALDGSIVVAGDEILLSISIQNIHSNLAGASVQIVLRYWDGNFLALLSSDLGTITKTEAASTIAATCKIPSEFTDLIEEDDRLKFSLQLAKNSATETILSGEFGLIGSPSSATVLPIQTVIADPTPTPPTITNIETRIEVPFSFGDASPKTIGVPIKGYIPTCSILIVTPFNGSTPSSISLGSASAYAELIPAIAPSEAAEYEFYPVRKYTTATQLYLSISPGEGCTQGSGLAIVDYADV